MSDRYRCAAESRERGENLAGTASTVRRWLAIEQPGAWGADALSQSRMAPDTARALRDLGTRHGIRIVLLRRHGRTSSDGPRTAIAADTSSGAGRTWSIQFEDPAELVELDLGRFASGGSPGGDPLTAPVYLVCTHGSHDACCAEFGRVTAAALAEVAGDRTWECSHIGGDRFATNVVVLPHGVYHGRVTAADAEQLVARHDTGRTLLHTYRGRSQHPFVVQAAEAALRHHLDEDRLDAVTAPARHERDGRMRRVPLVVGEQQWLVDIEVEDAAPCLMTCRADAPASPPSFRVAGIRST